MNWDHFNMWLYGIITSMVAGIIYLVRMVFTNNTQIQLLKQQLILQHASLERRDDKIDSQLVEIRSDIKTLMKVSKEKD